MPALPTTGRVRHVVPGTGGGTGSTDDPFLGIAAAQASAQPGDLFLVHAGSYGGRIRFDHAGAVGAPVVWLAAGDGEVRMNGIDIAASHVWLEGLTVRALSYATFSIGAPENVVIRRCTFLGNHYGVYLQQGGRYWYIADNTIVGDTPAASESFDGEGIELNTTEGHTVAHNRITNVADGVSYPLRNVDITGNDIFDVSDDGIEGDYGYANVRMWRNRIHNAVHNGISFQPQYAGP
jgi:nitrous oxidase accessory protein NosD